MITTFTQQETQQPNPFIGGKAQNLGVLTHLGFNVPKYLVISSELLSKQLPETFEADDISSLVDNLRVHDSLLDEIKQYFGTQNQTRFAVRSSGLSEDGAIHSFAGQYKTCLNVDEETLGEAILSVWKSAFAESIITYNQSQSLPLFTGLAVIIQEIVLPEVSGVAFGANPITKSTKNKVINSVFGLGEGLVSGELNSDHFEIQDSRIKKRIANKEFFISTKGNGLEKRKLEPNRKSESSLTDKQIYELCQCLDQLEKHFGKPQDIEFCYADNQLYLLQTRPITGLTIDKGEYTLWDNSNIVESYPGITTPLTFSFILKMYESVYRQFVQLMGVNGTTIERHRSVFANTLGLVRGRVYYNLLNWYKMLAMLPGYSLNAQFMENMMGVKERFELQDAFKMSKGRAWIRIVGMVINIIAKQVSLKKERKRFQTVLHKVLHNYQDIDFSEMEIKMILDYYEAFERELLLEWKAPLINDFFAMIWFGLLQKQCEQHFPENPNLHNDLLCGSNDIISTEPITRTLAISEKINQDERLKKLFIDKTSSEIQTQLDDPEFLEVRSLIDSYIKDFGDRCIGELKLESISYSQNPAGFIEVLKSYVQNGIMSSGKKAENIEQALREQAERIISEKFTGQSLKGRWFRFVLSMTRDLVSNRENLRYERTRAFGMVRKMFTAIGIQLEKTGMLENGRDVFFLKLEEIKALHINIDLETLREKVSKRKDEFKSYQKQPIPKERFFSYGNDFSDEYIYSEEKLDPIQDDLSGIGCCPGKVEGTIKVVNSPKDLSSLNGDILVTNSTDPGWVVLFPSASAILVERGSLLSHSAIVSREMGIPCIVGIDGLLRSLRTGDRVRMDGQKGHVEVLERAKHIESIK